MAKAHEANVVAYLRVSSRSQKAAMQRSEIETAAAARKEVIGQWYEDRFTGAGAHPPGLVRMLAEARRGRIRRLYVYRVDRLGRRGARDTFNVVHELESNGVEILNIGDPFSLAAENPMRDMLLAMMGWLAQMERNAIGERIAAARRRVERKGGRWGRPPRMTPMETERARELVKRGKTQRQIAMALKVPKATLWRALQKPPPRRAPRNPQHERA